MKKNRPSKCGDCGYYRSGACHCTAFQNEPTKGSPTAPPCGFGKCRGAAS